ncbi:hypothetical protein RJ641_029004 [Dillenia turbinata]|uniref:RING-type E3 ubiquitin transferase n=1 Tax=Dillenia turbinata TaxID=194707 RepID=A0AAN8VQT7_9MAGN
MFDPVVIASGQTFEKTWIKKWLNDRTCPKMALWIIFNFMLAICQFAQQMVESSDSWGDEIDCKLNDEPLQGKLHDDLEAQKNGAEVLLAFLKPTSYLNLTKLDSKCSAEKLIDKRAPCACCEDTVRSVLRQGYWTSHHISALHSKASSTYGGLVLAGYCIKIFKNLCNIKDAFVALDESEICIASFAKLLDNGSRVEQEYAVEVILSLCYLSSRYCDLVIQDNAIPSLVNLSINSSIKGKVVALELVQLLRVPSEYVAGECPGSKCDNLTEPRDHSDSNMVPCHKLRLPWESEQLPLRNLVAGTFLLKSERLKHRFCHDERTTTA